MFVQRESGYDADRGPCWIGRVRFSASRRSGERHGSTLRRHQGVSGDIVDAASGHEGWYGPEQDRTDARCSGQQPKVEVDVRAEDEAFLSGAALPGRGPG